MNYLLVFSAAALVALTAGCGDKGALPNPVISPGEPTASAFADTSLEMAVRQALKKLAGILSEEDLLSLTQLEARGRGIGELKGIEQLKNLTALDLADNRIRDITPLAALIQLKFLDLDNNQVSDLSPLAGLSQLESLILDRNRIEDLTPLLNLTQLRNLEVSGNPLNTTVVNSQLPVLQNQGVQVVFRPGEDSLAEGSASSIFRIALVSGVFGEQGDIFLLKTDGSAPANLTQKPDKYFNLAWSPDGNRFVFVVNSPAGRTIFSMDADGGNKKSLTTRFDSYGELAWSPDGMQIALLYKRHLFIMNADGSGLRSLDNDQISDDYSPTWSPDGTRIAFLRLVGSKGNDYLFDVYVMSSDGTSRVRLNEYPTVRMKDYSVIGWSEQLAWSPDGERLAFSQGTIREPGEKAEVYTADAVSSTPINLTGHPGADWEPAWSPDGTQIAFVSDRDGNWEIYVMNEDGSNPINLSRDPAQDLLPKWSPDGKQLAYLRALDKGRYDLYLIDNQWC